jgi:putative ATP-dependent endonuclease of OLD family
MRIVNFAINNFRGISGGIERNRIDFNGINTLFIFGQNNTGKSTFLRAYEYFYRDTAPGVDDHYRKNPENTIDIEIEVELDDWDRQRIESAAPNAKESYKTYLIDDARLRLRTQWRDGKKTALTWKPETQSFVEIG